jgi:hypothetical protein
MSLICLRFINELDLAFVLALADTSSWNEVLALRPAIRRHLARETSIQVHVPVCCENLIIFSVLTVTQYTGFATFHLEFSLPYLILEERDPSNAPSTDSGNTADCLKTDLSFLGIESRSSGRAASFTIWKVHETVLVFGCDSSEWTGYAFSSYRPHVDNTQEEQERDENDEQDSDDEMPNEDFFATGGTDYDNQHVPDASAPIWDPRAYFLHVISIRTKIIHERYIYFIRTLSLGLNSWVRYLKNINSIVLMCLVTDFQFNTRTAELIILARLWARDRTCKGPNKASQASNTRVAHMFVSHSCDMGQI